MLFLAAPGLAAAPIKGARYAGKTSQGQAVSFRVSRSGRSISALRILSDDACSDGVVSPGPSIFDSFPVSKVGHFDSFFGQSNAALQKRPVARLGRLSGQGLKGGRELLHSLHPERRCDLRDHRAVQRESALSLSVQANDSLGEEND